MIGIQTIVSEIPDVRIDTAFRSRELGIGDVALPNTNGILHVARRFPGQDASDLCIAAARKLLKAGLVDPADIDCAVVVTQSPDGYGIPHTAAVLQRKLRLSEGCASFDIGLGGSGYVYGLAIAKSFMESNRLRTGLLFTADPNSRVVDENDPTTALRFGDAATVTLLSERPNWTIGRFDLGTAGAHSDALEVRLDSGGHLHIDAVTLDDTALDRMSKSIAGALGLNELTMDHIDRFVVQQGGRALVEAIGQKLAVPGKVGFYAGSYGDTGSSSVPLVLEQNLAPTDRQVLISGFGAGLSWATTVLTRVD